jgi:hypothetical protein
MGDSARVPHSQVTFTPTRSGRVGSFERSTPFFALCASRLTLSFLPLAGAPPLISKGGFIRTYNPFSPPISAATSF